MERRQTDVRPDETAAPDDGAARAGGSRSSKSVELIGEAIAADRPAGETSSAEPEKTPVALLDEEDKRDEPADRDAGDSGAPESSGQGAAAPVAASGGGWPAGDAGLLAQVDAGAESTGDNGEVMPESIEDDGGLFGVDAATLFKWVTIPVGIGAAVWLAGEDNDDDVAAPDQPQNQPATLGGDLMATVTEDDDTDMATDGVQTVATGTLTATDPDDPDDVFMPQDGTDTDFGTFSIDADGNWTYTLDNANTEVTALNVGDTLEDQIPVLTGDGTIGAVTITIEGANDAPVAMDDTAEGTTGGDITVDDVLANDEDVDNELTPDSVASFTQPASGSVAYNDDGTFTYTPDTGFTGDDTFEYTLEDGQGATDTATVTVTVNDAAAPAMQVSATDEADALMAAAVAELSAGDGQAVTTADGEVFSLGAPSGDSMPVSEASAATALPTLAMPDEGSIDGLV
ncbi:MAG: VCBS domain-containing protein [Salinisphaeraceae bacterium]